MEQCVQLLSVRKWISHFLTPVGQEKYCVLLICCHERHLQFEGKCQEKSGKILDMICMNPGHDFCFFSTLLTFHRCLVSCGCLFLLAYLAVMFMISLNVVNYLAFTKNVFFKQAHQICRSRMTQQPIILSPIALSFLINASVWI